MNDEIRVLLVEGDDDDARRIEVALGTSEPRHAVERVGRLQEGLDRIAAGFDVALLDLNLADTGGLEAFLQLHAALPALPVVVIAGASDEALALQAVNLGAQDFISKDALYPELVRRTLRYAIERQRLLFELRELALRDDLTGLYNRRGLLTLGEQYARIAERKGGHVVVMFIDLDDMKGINDRFGHAAGDRAVAELAEILRETFRKSDVLARVGGDEFCALLTETTSGAVEIAIARLYGVIAGHNARGDRPYRLSVSVGRASWEGEGLCDFEALVRAADHSMYAQKQRGLKAA